MNSLRNKLSMCALVVVSSIGVADAASVTVFEAPLDTSNQKILAGFAVNRELGRAWIDVQVEWPSPGEAAPYGEVISKKVEGLYYDSARKQVLYRTATGPIVCAEDATILWSTYLKSTGQCQLTPVSEQRKVDDGFEIRERTVAKVLFDAPSN
jgi:hypothetical protein